MQSDVSTGEMAALRPPGHLLVAIDRHDAMIYRGESIGTAAEQLVPYDPHGYAGQLRSRDDGTEGEIAPERKSFYEAIATTLRGADRILIIGGEAGAGSAMDHLLAELNENYGDVADRVVGTVVVDADGRTEKQLLARARKFFASDDLSELWKAAVQTDRPEATTGGS